VDTRRRLKSPIVLDDSLHAERYGSVEPLLDLLGARGEDAPDEHFARDVAALPVDGGEQVVIEAQADLLHLQTNDSTMKGPPMEASTAAPAETETPIEYPEGSTSLPEQAPPEAAEPEVELTPCTMLLSTGQRRALVSRDELIQQIEAADPWVMVKASDGVLVRVRAEHIISYE
jgi:hypothetical protein